MIHLTSIDLLTLQDKLKFDRDKNGQLLVMDPLRRKYILTTPEEIVRQLWIIYLLEVKKLSGKLIAVERVFLINGMKKRFDMVIFDTSAQPVLLAEFKGPGIPIRQSAFDQIAQYNMQLQVPYSLVSNGSMHYCFEIDDVKKRFNWRSSLPV